jgi:hypothetical protein
MQPCAVCGGFGIDASGYCVNCRTFRGVTGQASPAGYGQTNTTPYQAGTVPYQPSVAPYQPSVAPYQTSAAPYQAGAAPYSISVAPYPASFPGAGGGTPQRQRGPLTVPLIALSVTLVLLVVAIVVVVIFRDRTPSETSLVDTCVVGQWAVTTMTMDIVTDSFGTVHFTNVGSAGKVTYSADGKGIRDYGDGTEFVADVTGGGGTRKMNLKISGTARYDVRTANSAITTSNVQSTGTMVLTVTATGASSSQDLVVDADTAKYSCEKNSLTIYTEMYRAESSRSG